MSQVRVMQPHAVSVEDAIGRMKEFEEMMAKYGARSTWSGSRARIQGTGVSGSIEVDPSQVVVTIQLGMLARVAGVDPARLEGSIGRRLKAAFEGF